MNMLPYECNAQDARYHREHNEARRDKMAVLPLLGLNL